MRREGHVRGSFYFGAGVCVLHHEEGHASGSNHIDADCLQTFGASSSLPVVV